MCRAQADRQSPASTRLVTTSPISKHECGWHDAKDRSSSDGSHPARKADWDRQTQSRPMVASVSCLENSWEAVETPFPPVHRIDEHETPWIAARIGRSGAP